MLIMQKVVLTWSVPWLSSTSVAGKPLLQRWKIKVFDQNYEDRKGVRLICVITTMMRIVRTIYYNDEDFDEEGYLHRTKTRLQVESHGVGNDRFVYNDTFGDIKFKVNIINIIFHR